MSDMDELGRRIMEQEERLRKQVYVEGENLILNVAYEYPIELSRCDSMGKIVSWTVHLCEKTWMTTEILERFIRVAARHHSLEIPDA